MNTKKILVTKISQDVSGMSDTVIELSKALLRQQGIDNGLTEDQIDFEVLYSNEEDRVTSMLKAVQSEFKAASTALELSRASEEEIAEAEKSDGIAEFLRLVFSGFFDEDEESEDE